MNINYLSLENFRNYKSAEVEFSKEQNIIFGENAQGKTNLLESVFYLSCLKTFRGSRDADSIMRDEDKAKIVGSFSAYGRDIEISCSISKSGRKLYVNGIPERRPSNHIGLIKTVFFSPDDLQLIKEGPALRRRFMNIAISQLRPSYIKALSEHNKIIESKRKILKMEEERDAYSDYYDILNEKLSACAALITKERGAFLKELNKAAGRVTSEISSGREEMKLSYNCDSAVIDCDDADNKKKILEHLNARKRAEFESRSCLVGAHRDDFSVIINGISAKDFASQGQIRSAVLALKIAEHEILEKESGEAPIFLLDDVLSELDSKRRSFLINDIKRGQTIITGCDSSMFSELMCGKIFTVSAGKIIGEEIKE